MTRPWKITLISLGSLLGLIAIVLTVLSIILFSGKNLASVLRSQLNQQDQIEYTLDNADLVFFKTFPEVSIHVENFGMKTRSSQISLLQAQDVYAALDLKAFLFRNQLSIRKVTVDGVFSNVTALLDSFSFPEEEKQAVEEPFVLPFGLIDISELSLQNVDLLYHQEKGIHAQVADLALAAQLNTQGQKGKGYLQLEIPELSFALNDTVYVSRLPLSAELAFQADLEDMKIDISQAHLQADQFPIAVQGNVSQTRDGKIATNLKVGLDNWRIERLMRLVPEAYAELVKDLSAAGMLSMDVKAEGFLAEKEIPLLAGSLNLSEADFSAPFLPVTLDRADASLTFRADLNEEGSTDVQLESLRVQSGTNRVSVAGKVKNVTENPAFDLDVNAQVNLAEVMPLLPDSLNVKGKGQVKAALQLSSDLKQVTEQHFDQIKASGALAFEDLSAVYADTVSLNATDLQLKFALNQQHADSNGARNSVDISTSYLDMAMGQEIRGILDKAGFQVSLKELPSGGKPLELFCDFGLDSLKFQADSILAAVAAPKGSLTFQPSLRAGGQGRILCDYDSDRIQASMGSRMSLDTRKVSVKASVDRDSSAKDLLTQWQPQAEIDFNSGHVVLDMFPDAIDIPAIDMNYAEDTLTLNQGSFAMGDSDFRLSGTISDIQKSISGEGLLKAILNFESEHADIDQLMDYFSGMGTEEEEMEEDSVENEISALADNMQIPAGNLVAQTAEGDPFMVPKGIDLTLNTNIASATAFGNSINNVAGEVTIHDGVAILRQLGFTSDAAKMQLTAMYKSPRKNHLFAGLDFHLIDIEIDKLIQMVPKVDSLVPMLKSFSGQAEFHLALETNLNSRYELKKSTILGAAAIEGRNLVVLDSETFDTIAKMMMFKKSSKNMIDSLAVDMTVFRDEIDIYPFVVSMDNYKVILSGRHNLDMSFNYHLDCVSPIRLGLDVKGSLGNLKFGITPTRYRNLFTPERRNDVQERTFELMNRISSSLKESVVEQ